jgi:hypothetical protein
MIFLMYLLFQPDWIWLEGNKASTGNELNQLFVIIYRSYQLFVIIYRSWDVWCFRISYKLSYVAYLYISLFFHLF